MPASSTVWAGWQWANASGFNGAALFFRRARAPPNVEVELVTVVPHATYKLSYYYNYTLGRTEEFAGAELSKFVVSMPDSAPASGQSSVLVEYIRVR